MADVEPAREIAQDVLGASAIARVEGAHLVVGVEQVSEATGEVFEYWLVRGDGTVIAPRIAAALGLAAQVEELGRRLAALGYTPEAPDDLEAPESEDPEDPEAYEALVSRMRERIALGLVSLVDMLDGEGEELPEDPRTLRRLQDDMIAAVRVQLAAEAAWPSPGDVDRLAAAFAELERRGIATAFGFPPTHSGGWESVRERADELAAQGIEVWGAAFFHEQDVEHALAGGGLTIAFGGLDEAPSPDDERAGEAVVEVLRAHGFAPAWGGDVDTKIALPVFAWQRRRADIDDVGELRLHDAVPAAVLEVLPRLRRVRLDPTITPIDQLASPSVEQVTLDYPINRAQPFAALEIEAALPALRAQLRARFPELRTLTVEAGALRDVTTW